MRYEEGDAWLDDGSGVEIKTSVVTPLKGSKVSLTGLKLWEEKVKYYLLIVIDLRDLVQGPQTHVMWVSREEMLKAESQGLMNTPGMKKSKAAENVNVQKGLQLKMSEVEEWTKQYPAPDWLKL